MLRAYVLDFKGNWEDPLPLIEFAYNNTYHAGIQIAPYEALYGWKCMSPIGWFKVGETKLMGPKLMQRGVEKVKMIRGDRVFLRVLPMKGVMRFRKKGKLSPRYIRPYRIIQKVGQVAYKLKFPLESDVLHPVFHVSLLRKFLSNPSRSTPIKDIQVTKNLSYEEILVAILDRQVRKLQTKEVSSVKVLWRNNNIGVMTWEAEEDMKSKYPHLFHTTGDNNETTIMGTTQND
ncbi:PREDICTED: uncharacterized protein LOC109220646 [Nicotiana attenuata]|uniref:uncharacterized protein LOC109220646 n=1 Tax=Nicotiana attenuata TaxID=49451 RepID=UPI000905454C|nr:PREDICTED: uncharacterized protein LOC109220646 [Nicotiana attenuata]